MSESVDNKSKINRDEQGKNSQRLTKMFAMKPTDLLLTSKNNQRTQANKKSYAPNLNVTRNKNTESKLEEKSTRKDSKDRSKNHRGNGKPNLGNNSRRNNNLVQTMGFLSEGIGASPVVRKSNYSGHSSRGDAGSSMETLSRPRIIKRDEKPNKEELDSEIKILSELLEDDYEEDIEYYDDMVPIKINNNCNINKFETNDEKKIKQESIEVVNVKSEPNDSPQLPNGMTIKLEPETEHKTEEFQENDGFFHGKLNQLMLFQLPDSLPGRVPEADEAKEATDELTTLSIKSKAPKLCSMEHLDEGLIGKLVRYKSGKTKLLLGDSVYDVESGLSSDFQQHAITINTNKEQRSANMYSLGEIQSKFNITPDWFWLFEKMKNP